MSLDNEDTAKFWKAFASEYQSRNFLEDLSALQDSEFLQFILGKGGALLSALVFCTVIPHVV